MRSPRRLAGWPRSLQGQILLAITLVIFLGQGISAALLWRAQHERRISQLVNTAAFRLVGPGARHLDREGPGAPGRDGSPGQPPDLQVSPPSGQRPAEIPAVRDRGGDGHRGGPFRARLMPGNPARPGERHLAEAEATLHQVLAAQGLGDQPLVMVERALRDDPEGQRLLAERRAMLPVHDDNPPTNMVVAGLRRPDGQWLVARLPDPESEQHLLLNLALQTLAIYVALVLAVAWIVRRITRPIAALTTRVEAFARDRTAKGQLDPSGPDDIRGLITAHNAMEMRIAGLLDEKDVMLGAIGHDLKTPLAALRVRIESVENDADRAPMAAGIEDINRTLDDILSLARVGRPTDPLEPTELGALVGAVVDEYEDMGEPVTLEASERIVLPLRATWLRRALRNLASNAVRYAGSARVTLRREAAGQGSTKTGFAVLVVEDDGPGIPEADVDRMVEPFTRLEASRNTGTGGAGIGLTLARAIAEQHGGSLTLANCRSPDGRVVGLSATIRLPL
jgi:signal transduction histidine kinase